MPDLPLPRVDRGRQLEAAHVLAAAFMRDPFFLYLVPDERKRYPFLITVMRESLELVRPHGQGYGIELGGRLAGSVLCLPPGKYPVPAWRDLRFLMPLLGAGCFRSSPQRIWNGLRMFARMQKEHLAGPHWYVLVLGVHPLAQGRRLGQRLLRPVIDRAAADGVSVWLETSNPDNHGFYRRMGFELQEELRFGDGLPTIATMLHPAR